MLIILAPAKIMDMSPKGTAHLPFSTEPLYGEDALKIAARMRSLSEKELAVRLKINGKLAEQNYERYQLFGTSANPRKEAIVAFNGTVFRALDAGSLSSADLEYAQDRIRIVSTLYGLIRPLDRIEAHRISFKLKLFPEQGALYNYWQGRLTDPVIEATRQAGGILVNLASQGIAAALDWEKIRSAVTVVTPEFREWRNGRYEVLTMYSKTCRGAMTRYIVENRIETPDDLVRFMWNGFAFNPEISEGERYVFTRERNPGLEI